MKKKIKISILFIFIIFIAAILLSMNLYKVNAGTNMGTVAQYSYNTIMGYSPSGLINDTWTYDGDTIRFNLRNYLCLEKYVTTANVNFYVAAVIDINEDGTDPNSYTYYYKTNSGYSSDSGSSKKMAKLAYISWYSEKNKSSKSYDSSFAFGAVWEGESAKSLIAGDMPECRTYEKNDLYSDATDYANNGSTSDGKTISARIIIFKGGAMQNTAMLYGKASESSSFTIDKYITKVEDVDGSAEGASDYGDSRANKDDNSKQADPVKIYYGKVKITYTIKIKNTGSSTLKGTLKDVYETQFLSNISGLPSGTIEIKANETKTYTITLYGNSSITSGKYKNTATFTVNGKEKSSSDWIQLGELKAIKINKYIESIGGNSFYRSNMSETQKASNPANGGENTSRNSIVYKIVLENPNSSEITGTFKDSADSAISINSIRGNNGTSISNGGSITLGANEKMIITINATVSNASAGIYENTAQFTYDTIQVESSDYLEISGVTKTDASIQKYISKVENSSGSFKSGRASMSITSKNSSPAEVIKGSYVTYTVTITNNVHYDNTSGSKHGEICSHTERHYLDYLKCTDVYDSSYLQYVSISGTNSVKFNSSTKQIIWSNVEEGDTVTANIKFKVIASDLKLTNIENKVNNIQYEYTKYRCTVYHGTYYTVSCSKHGSHTRCTHTACGFNHNTSTIKGSLDGEDSDYVRVLDPTISGYVWFDTNKNGYKDDGEGATKVVNGVTYNASDVKVELVNANTDEVIATTTPNSTGYYTFGRVRKGKVIVGSNGSSNGYTNVSTGQSFYYSSNSYMSYYIRFNYFGERFIATTYNAENEWGGSCTKYTTNSDAREENREEFNNSFETIAYNKAYAGTTSNSSSKTLKYNKSGHVSTLIWGSSDKEKESTTMQAYIRSIYPNTEYNETSKPYLQYLNLGLQERSEEGDLTLTKDVYTAEVTVNGYQTIYTYNNLAANSLYALQTPYKLRIYREDYEFRTSNFGTLLSDIANKENPYTSYERDGDNDLNIIITYKITVTNNSNLSDAVVREIIDYSSTTMTPLYVRLDSPEGTSLTLSDTSSFYNKNEYSSSEYNTKFIQGSNLTNKKISAGGKLDIYVAYIVDKDTDGYVKIDSTSSLGKVNIAEIAAFSFYNSGTNTPTGIVDKNSNPANTKDLENLSEDVDEYEDDTFRTSIQILLRDDPNGSGVPSDQKYRKISGTVWEDINTELLNSGGTINQSEQLVGNGVKDGSEKGINLENQVRVKLMEVIRDTKGTTNTDDDEEYLIDTGIETLTDSNGNYTLTDSNRLHAGQYVVRFIYGSDENKLTTSNNGDTIKYSGQDYKSTTYKVVGSDDEDGVVEATAFSETAAGKTCSFAKDNELRRLEVINYSTQMTYQLDNILKSTSTTGDLGELAKNTAMYADTKKFNIQVEYKDYYTDFSTYTYNGLTVKEYKVNKIDFGLIERPKTKLQLMNDISEIIAVKNDGTELVHLYFDITYNYVKNADSTYSIEHTTSINTTKSIGFENVQCLNRNGANQGFRYVNIDTDLLQGMTITLKFQIGIVNYSDVDTSSQNLIDMVKENQLENIISVLKSETKFKDNAVYGYNNNNQLSQLSLLEKQMISSYSYLDLKQAIQNLKNNSAYQRYLQSNDTNYNLGYFIGKTYYSGKYEANDVKVETRIDQIVDYVDNDLIFRVEENLNENNQVKYLTYSIAEIAQKHLLMNVTENSTITDGYAYYITDGKNNLAFNIENAEINSGLYKYQEPILPYVAKKLQESELYIITLQASRTLSSEADLDGVTIDNLAEIVKISNTVGRKAYIVNSSDSLAGYIGNSTKNIDKVHGNILLAAKESDTDFTEFVTFSPPTGLSQIEVIALDRMNNVTKYVAVGILTLIVVLGTSYVGIQFARRKKFYK